MASPSISHPVRKITDVRPGGHLMRVHAHIDKVTNQAGAGAARELSQFQARQVYAMKRVSEKEKLDCDALLVRYLETSLSQSQADEQRKVYEKQVEAGLDYVEDVSYIGPKYLEAVRRIFHILF
jgi:hypothetical protein